MYYENKKRKPASFQLIPDFQGILKKTSNFFNSIFIIIHMNEKVKSINGGYYEEFKKLNR